MSDLYCRKSIREALKAQENAEKLGQHPLASLQLVKQQGTVAQRPFLDTPANRGIILRQILRDLITELPSPDTVPDFTKRRWRWHFMLQEQYFNGRSVQEIRTEIGISASGYFTEQRRALDYLANELHEAEIALGKTIQPQSTSAYSPSLPEHPTPFIGRQEEHQKVADLLHNPQCRLLSLTGSGGVGKTRLAIEVGKKQNQFFPSGVYFIPLAPLESVDFVITAVANALRLNFDKQQDPKQQLLDFLRRKETLLILDNFEHMMDAVPLINEILQYAPAVKMLITSRERLHIRGEWVVELQGLRFPATIEGQHSLAEYDAVQLFMQAIERTRTNRTILPQEFPDLIRICQLVHGLPLALELAAGWSNLISCAEIVAEIEKGLDFLATPLRDLPQRHQSLRAVFDHSWALLTSSEQEIFCKLSLFRGRFEREAAAQVAHAGLSDLLTLSNKSLLRRRASGQYQVHELLRQFAAEKLATFSDLYATTQNKYGRYFANFLSQHNDALKQGSLQKETVATIMASFENVWATWELGLQTTETPFLQEMVEPLRHIYFMQNQYRQGEETFARLATLNINSRLTGLALGFQGDFNFRLGCRELAQQQLSASLTLLQKIGADYELALIGMLAIHPALPHPNFAPEKLYATSTAVFTERNDQWGLAACDFEMGQFVYGTSDIDKHERTQKLLARSLTLRRTLGDLWGEAACLHYMGHMAFTQGNYAKSEQYTQKSLEIYRTIGDQMGIADAYNNLGQIATTQGNYAAALSFYNEMLIIREEFGNRQLIAECLDSLGYVAYLSKDDQTAVTYYDQSLLISREINDTHGIAWSLHNLGDIARRHGDYAQATTLYHQSQEIHNAHDPFAWGRAAALEKLGRTALLVDELDEADAWLNEAFQIGMKMKRYREAGDALLGMIYLWLARGGDEAMALRFLTAVLNHQATAQDTRDKAQQLTLQLEGKLDTETAVNAHQTGENITFSEVAKNCQLQNLDKNLLI